jgi:hypothetical protein
MIEDIFICIVFLVVVVFVGLFVWLYPHEYFEQLELPKQYQQRETILENQKEILSQLKDLKESFKRE